jgi:hypothetical protein
MRSVRGKNSAIPGSEGLTLGLSAAEGELAATISQLGITFLGNGRGIEGGHSMH